MKKVKNLILSDLILIRLISSPDSGLTISEQKKSLKHFFLSPPSGEEWLHELEQLTQQGALEKIGKTRFRITLEGEKDALKILNLSLLPKPIRWQTLKNCYLVAAILELPAPINDRNRQRIASSDGLRASILANAYQLSIASYSSLTKTRDSLLWQQLTDTTVTANLKKRLTAYNAGKIEPFTQGSIMTLLLNNLLETERRLPWESALKQLAAKVVNARRVDAEELRFALLKTATANPKKNQEQPFDLESFDLESFAAQVKESAKLCQTGKFGDNKIFISHVWQQMGLDGKQFRLSLDQFKHYLALANNKSLLRLSRADLAYAMDQDAIAASKTHYLNTIFHFIRLEP